MQRSAVSQPHAFSHRQVTANMYLTRGENSPHFLFWCNLKYFRLTDFLVGRNLTPTLKEPENLTVLELAKDLISMSSKCILSSLDMEASAN